MQSLIWPMAARRKPRNMSDLWFSLSPALQDRLTLVLLLLPAGILGFVVLRGFRPFGLIRDMGRRYLGTNLVFILLIASSVGLGTGLLATERGLRRGTARAADKFDLIVAAPGSEMTMLLAAVYLQPSDVPLLTGAQYQSVAEHETVTLAAPIAFGDSVAGAPVVGTIADFVSHLSPELAEGRLFAAHGEAVVGALSPLRLGEEMEPAHGAGPGAEEHAHEGEHYRVVGRMRPSGSPWDRAILVPVETVWETHGLANGHAPARGEQVGPPFDPAYFPGTPAILVRGAKLVDAYNLKADFTRPDMMAFFPGAVLAGLQARLGDVRTALSLMASVTQVLVTLAVLAALMILARLFARSLALLRALGAPGRFIFAVVWGYSAGLICAGALLGLGLGLAVASGIGRMIGARTDIAITVTPGWPEAHLVAGFVSLTLLLAMVPAVAALRRTGLAALRR
jgi:putative ABC transport system permease protein